jgi:uncharacterized membrane protein
VVAAGPSGRFQRYGNRKGDIMKKTKFAAFFLTAALLVAVAAPFAHAEDSACVFEVSPAAVAVSNDSSADVKVTASGAGCACSVKSDVDWVSVSPAQLQGSGTVHLTILPSVEPKAGTVKIAGQEITILQSGLGYAPWGN